MPPLTQGNPLLYRPTVTLEGRRSQMVIVRPVYRP